METIELLDVTVIEPKLKHPTVFKKFDALDNGKAFIIKNDHDPKPLYYQLVGERGDVFTWEYLESGPDFWRVKIEKKNIELEFTIGELVAKDFRRAEIFKKYNLDFCCGGKKTVTQACADKKIDHKEIEKELSALDNTITSSAQNFDEWELDFLIDYILSTHHEYIRKAIPLLIEYTSKVAKVHGERHPEVVIISQKFDEIAEELYWHMHKEEQILFPYIKQLLAAKANKEKAPYSAFGTIEKPIHMMEHEHDVVGDKFKEIQKLSQNYNPPADSCATYKVSFFKLKEFEEDLHQHIHLENNILFPKSLKLEHQF